MVSYPVKAIKLQVWQVAIKEIVLKSWVFTGDWDWVIDLKEMPKSICPRLLVEYEDTNILFTISADSKDWELLEFEIIW